MSELRPFCMPKWGIEMTEGTIAEWMVKDGDAISKGDILCLIETSKITNEVEAEREGVVLRIVHPASDTALPVGALIAVFGDAGASEAEIADFIAGYVPATGGAEVNAGAEEIAQPEPAEPRKAAPVKIETNRPISPKALELAEQEGVDIAAIEGSGRGGRITFQDVSQHLRPQSVRNWRGTAQLVEDDRKVFASPLARRLAAIHGVQLAGIRGTGPRGRISKSDVLALVPQAEVQPVTQAFAPVANTATVEPFDKIRKVVAKRLSAAKQDIPHFYLRTSAAVDDLLAMRKTANLVLGSKATINDYLVWASAKALVRHPDVNVQVHGEEIHRFPHADVAIAVASPKGLVAPILRQVDRMRIDQLAAASSALIDKAKAGRLAYDDLDGGTFSVSNLGMFGIEDFDAIINPPQAAILAVGKASRELREDDDGEIAVETRIKLTLSVDHRVIDGAAGAAFLATLKSLIEEPEQLFA